MASRRGGFGGGNLDPFGGGSGGLGRYNISGETISSLEEYEAYVVAVAWANGEASDEEYIASLERLVSVSPAGSRQLVANQNRLEDAKYSIGRNKLARDVNNAVTVADRKRALSAMLAYDEARLKGMNTDNEAYREQLDRVAGLRSDIRQAEYSDMVTKVNRGQASTDDLLQLARKFAKESKGDPDLDEWQEAVYSLEDRKADEAMNEGYQAYQHNRLSGPKLLAQLEKRMEGLDPDSSRYKELASQAEDLRERIRGEDSAKREAEIQGRRNDGKVSDKEFLGYLRDEYENAPPGTTEKLNAGNRLREFTFSLAEDKLRYDVEKGKKPVSALVSFYKSARAGMTPGSERYRQLTLAIDRYSKGGYGSGGGGGRGGGGGGGGGGSGFKLGPKLMPGATMIVDVLGGPKPPKDFEKLFRVDVTSTTSKRWWDNNVRSMVDSFQRGDREWTYYDQRGNAYQLPFEPGMMEQFDLLNLNYAHDGLAKADNAREAQMWTGRVITATKALERRGGQYTMDVYDKTFKDIEKAKQQALAGGRYAEYANLVKEQTQLARFILGIAPSDPLDPGLASNPYLSQSQRDRISSDLSKLAPRNLDETSDFYNPEGDPVLGLMGDGGIQVSTNGNGDIIDAQLDENRGFLQQTESGVVLNVVDMEAPGGAIYDPAIDAMRPAYQMNTARVVVRIGGEDVEVRQEFTDGGIALPVYATGGAARGSAANGRAAYYQALNGKRDVSVEAYVVDSQYATLPLRTMNTWERGKKVTWVSLDGQTWLRYVASEGQAPRIVIEQGVTFDSASKKWMKDGKEVGPEDLAKAAHWWGPADSARVGGTGAAWGIGAPGTVYITRQARDDGTIDSRPDWMLRSEAEERMSVEAARERNKGLQGHPAPRSMDYDKDDIRGDIFEAETAQQRFARITAEKERETTVRRYMTDASKDDAFGNSGELLPVQFRQDSRTLAPTATRRLAPIDNVAKEIGLKPPPKPVLQPPPDARLDPVREAPKSTLAPVRKDKLPKKKPKNATGAKASGGKDDVYTPKPKPKKGAKGEGGKDDVYVPPKPKTTATSYGDDRHR